jgi:general transcription factor 3C polypeptide 5 (transcription factor C subunit 1)
VITRRQDRAANIRDNTERDSDRKNSHVFDGVTLTKETAAFQLCDIVDPMLKGMIEDKTELREACNERDGWYTTSAFERIKAVLRHKFFCLLEGHVATDEECQALLVPNQNKVPTTRTQKLRAGKHNMAKGALRPEDAAVSPLYQCRFNHALRHL